MDYRLVFEEYETARRFLGKLDSHFYKLCDGHSYSLQNAYEECVEEGSSSYLVQEIEGQYSRTDYPQVFKSIEYIQDAQVKSMKQSDLKPMTQKELLNVSFYKGGHSVLADAFLVKPDLTSDDMQFAFQYGAFLQLIDDLQDVKEDIRSKNRTYFNFKTTPSESDVKVEKLITYLFEVNDINDTDSTKQKIIKTVIRSSSLLLIMEAVSKNQSYISSDFYATLETYSKVRLSFYNKVQKEVQPLLNKWFSK